MYLLHLLIRIAKIIESFGTQLLRDFILLAEHRAGFHIRGAQRGRTRQHDSCLRAGGWVCRPSARLALLRSSVTSHTAALVIPICPGQLEC